MLTPLATGNGRRTTDDGLGAISIAVGDALEETVFLVGERVAALALDFLQELIHAALVGDAAFQFVLQLAGGAALQPALHDVRLLGPGRRRRLVALQARIALRE